MIKITDQRLWIAVHLLYPNSSQAADVYHTILSTGSKKNSADYSKKLFAKLENFFVKTPVVRSAHPFRIFEGQDLANWSILYQKSVKQHLLVIIGLTVFDFNVETVSDILKLSAEKTRFLVNQAFKKIVQFEVKKPEVQSEFKYKKFDDKRVSYFFTNENLVEYTLGLLSEGDRKAVVSGLALYPQLIELQKKYESIIGEIRSILKAELGPIEVPTQLTQSPKSESTVDVLLAPFAQNKKIMMTLTGVTVAIMAFVVIRPISWDKVPLKLGGNSIKMGEVNSQPYLTDEDVTTEEGNKQVNLNEMPVGTKKPLDSISESAGKPTQKPPQQVVDSKPPAPPKESTTVAKQGGLYRASLQVSDIDTVSTRITERFVSLGGKKAGEVELGWRKNPKLSYYHLTLPMENVEEARAFLSKFGRLTIQFENHPRTVPVGLKRMILEVKESE